MAGVPLLGVMRKFNQRGHRCSVDLTDAVSPAEDLPDTTKAPYCQKQPLQHRIQQYCNAWKFKDALQWFSGGGQRLRLTSRSSENFSFSLLLFEVVLPDEDRTGKLNFLPLLTAFSSSLMALV